MAVSCLASHPGLDAKRFAGYLVIIAALLLGIAPPSPANAAGPQPECRAMSGLDVCGRFLQEWSKYGSDQADVYVNGLPITAARPEISLNDGKTYDTQWFERSRYEAHPENKAPYDVLLGLLGASLVEGRGVVDPYTKKVRNPADQPFVGIDKPSDADGTTKMWFPETRHSVSGKILQYWQRYGGLAQFGFPLSEQFQEVSATDGKTYPVQYFERNRFEVHPEKQAPYEVELGLLGVQQYQLSPVAADQLPIAPPKGVKSAKDTLVIGISQEPGTVNDQTAINPGIYGALYTNLIGFDHKNNQFGELAWYVPTVENGGAQFVGTGDDRHLQIKYKMRPGMRWSDGVEITSNDVAYAYKSSFDPDYQTNNGFLDPVYNIDNPDKYTVIVNLLSYAQARDLYAKDKDRWSGFAQFVDEKRPVADYNYPRTLEALLAPEHELSKVAPKDQAAQGYFSDPNLLVTSGPFKLERWDRGRQMSLVPNPYYTLTDPPLLKRIIFRFITDHAEMVAQLKSGDIDVSSDFTSPNLEVQQLEQSGLTVISVPGNVWEHIEFNLSKPYFKEVAVRQAIAYAINRQDIVSQISFGKWPVSNGEFPPTIWSSLDNPNFPQSLKDKYPLKHYDYNPALANQMLDQAGWLRGQDGIRAKGGVKLSFNYDTTAATTSFRGQVQQRIQADLRMVGIDARPRDLTRDDLLGDNGVMLRRTFDFAEFAWIFEPDPAGNPYATSDIPTEANGFGGVNFSGYSNPRYDEAYNAAVLELDRSKRAPLLAEMQYIYAQDLPSIPLLIRSNLAVHNPRLMNWDPSAWRVPALYKSATIYFK